MSLRTQFLDGRLRAYCAGSQAKRQNKQVAAMAIGAMAMSSR